MVFSAVEGQLLLLTCRQGISLLLGFVQEFCWDSCSRMTAACWDGPWGPHSGDWVELEDSWSWCWFPLGLFEAPVSFSFGKGQ